VKRWLLPIARPIHEGLCSFCRPPPDAGLQWLCHQAGGERSRHRRGGRLGRHPGRSGQGKARRHTITHITLHHEGEPYKAGTDPRQYLRNLQQWSRNTKGWLDIPYHYIIDLEGQVYAGRDIAYAGDTNTEYDPSGHALIEVVGNFEEVEPNQAQLDAVVKMMAMLAKKYGVPVERIASHRDHSANTVCPGANLYRYVQSGYFREQVALRLKAQ
jgi:hypothetical protein